jgi:multiple sugar transport system permease protein
MAASAARRRKKSIDAALGLCTALGALAFLFPLFWMLRSSLMNLADLFARPIRILPTVVVFSNYARALSEMDFLQQLGNSLLVVVPVVVGTVLTSSLSAYGFARLRFPFRDALFGMVLSTMMLPSAVTLIPLFIAWHRLGLVGTFAPLVVPAWFGGGAYFIFLLRQFFLTIPRDLEEAAIIDGAGYVRVYLRIMLPLVKPALVVVALFSFIGQWNEFFNTLIYLGSREDLYTLTLGLFAFKGVFQSKYSFIMAAAAVVTLPSFLLFLVGNRYFVEGITMTGIKG